MEGGVGEGGRGEGGGDGKKTNKQNRTKTLLLPDGTTKRENASCDGKTEGFINNGGGNVYERVGRGEGLGRHFRDGDDAQAMTTRPSSNGRKRR